MRPRHEESSEVCFGHFGGEILSVDGEIPSVGTGRSETKLEQSRPIELRGYATRYEKLHQYQGYLDYFLPGCFARSLMDGRAIRLLVAHDESKCVATTADRLELHSDNSGLAFRCDMTGLRSEIFDWIGDRRGMSVKTRTLVEEVMPLDGYNVRLIKDAELFEISVGRYPIVRQAFAVIGDSTKGRSLSQLCRTNELMYEGASEALGVAVAQLARTIRA